MNLNSIACKKKKSVEGKTFFLLFLLAITFFSCSSSSSSKKVERIEVYFSPNGGIREAIVSKIDGAEKYVYVAMYSFTGRHLAFALKRAKEDGVDVRVVMCASATEDPFSKLNFLVNNNVPVRIDTVVFANGGIMHNKFCIIDDSITITGSYNWTGYAEIKNEENVLIIHSKDIAKKYKKRFKILWNRAINYKIPEIKVSSQNSIDALDKESIKKNVNRDVIIKGKVVNVGYSGRSNTYFLNFSKNRRDFTVVIFSNVVNEFLKKGISPRTFENKEVEVRGKLKYYKKYGYEIILKKVEDIWLVD